MRGGAVNQTQGAGQLLATPEAWVVDPVAVAMVDAGLACQHAVLPLGFDTRTRQLHLALTRPQDRLRREALCSGLKVECELVWHAATEAVVQEGLYRCYGHSTGSVQGVAFRHGQTQAPDDEDTYIVQLVDSLLHQAVAAGASDVHITPQCGELCIRIRRDGHMESLASVDAQWADSLAIRLKVMANLDVAETRRPQDGRFERLVCARRVDLRLSSFPIMYGENIVIRLHDHERCPANLASLGLDSATVDEFQVLLEAPPGLTVVCGPTGSGKTTTLYALLDALDDGTRSLMTLEDPVEYPLPGIVQASVDPSRAIDFASGARALLRQDPDVLMLGEIRDQASCRVAVRAALSGVRVLATLHASDSCIAIERLFELGATAGELAATLTGVIAQRLLRLQDGTGRRAVFEVLTGSSEVRAGIVEGLTPAQMSAIAFPETMRLWQQAAESALGGRIDNSEVKRVLGVVPGQSVDDSTTTRRCKDALYAKRAAIGRP